MENKKGLQGVIDNAVSVITRPVEFYRDMPKTGGYADPVIFVVVMAAVMGLAVALFSLLGFGVIGAMAAGLGAVIFMPIFALIGSFIGAAILFVAWRLMGSEQPYETAYRCVAYASALYPIAALLGMVPFLGTVVGVLWGNYLLFVASIEVHGIARKTAMVTFGIFAAIGLFFNVGSEMAARKAESHLDELSGRFEELGRQYDQDGEFDAGRAGRDMGEFVKSMQDAIEKSQRSRPAPSAPLDDAGSQDAPATSRDAMSSQQPMSAEQAGKVLGDFIKGFNETTQGNASNGSTRQGAAMSNSGQNVSQEASAIANDSATSSGEAVVENPE